MNLYRFFPLTVHVILACGFIGLAVGIHNTVPYNVLQASTATGLAVGFGITAFVRGTIAFINAIQ
jgi:hypothetical protein